MERRPAIPFFSYFFFFFYLNSFSSIFNSVVALLTDLFKAFYCLFHELLLAKLLAYGFSIAALTLIHSYLTKKKQRTKLNLPYSPWEDISFGVPYESILRPLLFNIFLCDLFFKMNETDFASYADDNTPYRRANIIDEVIQSLEHDSMMWFQRFSENQIKANISKCHLLVNKKDEETIRIADMEIKNSKYEKLLGIKVDTKLNFKGNEQFIFLSNPPKIIG